MAGNFILLDEAAKILGVSPDTLIEMRSRGEIHGYRDGTSWKFKPEEVQRVKADMGGDIIDEPIEGSSILLSERDLGLGGSRAGGSTGPKSDAEGSDVSLVAQPGKGSDVKLVAGRSGVRQPLSDDEDELRLAPEGNAAASPSKTPAKSKTPIDESSVVDDLNLSSTGSGIDMLGVESSDVLAPSDLGIGKGSSKIGSKSGTDKIITGDSDPDISSDLDVSDDDDLVLGGTGSDVGLGADSGINLMSPSDSGISLEDAPLDLAASGISGLDIASDSDVKKGPSASGSAASLVEFQQDEEFQLSPSSGQLDTDEDSGSQVIELEDSTEFGDAAVALPGGEMGMGDGGFQPIGEEPIGGAPTQMVAAVPEVPFAIWENLILLGILLLMCGSGILMTDLVRNMWGWNSGSVLTSGFTDMILKSAGL